MQGYDAKVSPYSGTGVPYWLSSTNYGDKPTVGGHTAGEMNRDSILKDKYNFLMFDQGWFKGKDQYRNYIMAKHGINAFTTNAQKRLPLCNLPQYPSNVEDRSGCTVDNNIQNTWQPIVTYVITDTAGNKRMVNMASDNKTIISGGLVALFGNLYKVSDEVSTQNVTITKDIIYLQPYTSTYTVDMVYKAEFKKGDKSEIDNFKPYLNINGYNYNSYIDKLLDNNFDNDNIRDSIDKSNIDIEIGSVLKTLPIQLQVNYKTPDTSIESFDTKYLLQPCSIGSKAPIMSVSGNYNSDTLYIYKDKQLQPWDTYTPSVYTGLYNIDNGDLIFEYLYNIDPENPEKLDIFSNINKIRFEKTDSGSLFKYENGDLYLASSTNYKDEARICTRNRTHDGNDPDQIVYAFNSKEKLVPWLAVLK